MSAVRPNFFRLSALGSWSKPTGKDAGRGISYVTVFGSEAAARREARCIMRCGENHPVAVMKCLAVYLPRKKAKV